MRLNPTNSSLTNDLFMTKSTNSDDRNATVTTQQKLGATPSDPEEKLKSMLGPVASGFNPSSSNHYHLSTPRSEFPHSIHQGAFVPVGNNYYPHPYPFSGPPHASAFMPPHPFYYPNPYYFPMMYPNPYMHVPPPGMPIYPNPYMAHFPLGEHRSLTSRSNFAKQTSQPNLD